MNEFKVGDKVKLRDDLKVGEKYEGVLFLSGMKDLQGKELTINYISEGDYTFEESVYYCSGEMLEKVFSDGDLLEFALGKLNIAKEELEKELREEYEKNKIDKQVVENISKRYRDFENYCNGKCCDDCDVEKFLKRNNMKEVSAGNCILIYEHLFNKEGDPFSQYFFKIT